MAAGFYFGLLVIGVALFCCYTRFGHLLRCISFTACSGVAVLLLLVFSGRFWDVPLAVTPLSAMISAILGVPGVVFMLVMNLL